MVDRKGKKTPPNFPRARSEVKVITSLHNKKVSLAGWLSREPQCSFRRCDGRVCLLLAAGEAVRCMCCDSVVRCVCEYPGVLLYLLGWNLQVCEVGRCVECARVGVWVLMCLFCVCLCVLGVICTWLSVLLVRYL